MSRHCDFASVGILQSVSASENPIARAAVPLSGVAQIDLGTPGNCPVVEDHIFQVAILVFRQEPLAPHSLPLKIARIPAPSERNIRFASASRTWSASLCISTGGAPSGWLPKMFSSTTTLFISCAPPSPMGDGTPAYSGPIQLPASGAIGGPPGSIRDRGRRRTRGGRGDSRRRVAC